MATKQIIGFGAKVERSDDGATDWLPVPEVKSIPAPKVTQEYPEATNLDSENGFREFIKGLKDAGEITMTMGYTADGYEMMSADNGMDDAIYYRVTMRPAPGRTVGDIFEFRAFPTPGIVDNGLGEPVDIEVTMRVTGAVNWTRATA